LAYYANVFRAQDSEGGRPAEFEQMGVELIGDGSVFADAEMILTAAEFLEELGIQEYRLTVGHAGLLKSILTELTHSEEQVKELRNLLVNKNLVGFEEQISNYNLSKVAEQHFVHFLTQASNVHDMEQLRPYIDDKNLQQVHMFSYLNELASILNQAGLSDKVTYDLTLTSEMSYYSGVLFEVFASGTGFAIGNGGRYDGLLKEFNSSVGATGFGLRVDRLLEVLAPSRDTKAHTLIFFDESHYVSAKNMAKELRSDGIRTTLQFIDSVDDKQALQEHFSHVIWLVEGDKPDE
jgi:ATP phosphoribosyltransferase regulatory subunit